MNVAKGKLFILAFLLSQGANAWGQGAPCQQFPPAGDDFSESLGVVIIEITMPFTVRDTIYVSGPTRIMRSDPSPLPTGKRVIDTEIVEMQLHGYSRFGPTFINLNPAIPSFGQIIGNPLGDFPAESFFDVFIQVDIPNLGTQLHNQDALQIRSLIDCIPPYGNPYRHELGGGVQLFDQNGNPVATILEAAHKLDTPLFSVVPGGGLDIGAIGPFEFAGRAFFGGGIVEPTSPALGWPPTGRVAPPLLGLVPGTPGATDNLNALSFGHDNVTQDTSFLMALTFSVDPPSAGVPGMGVDFEVSTGTAFGPPDAPAPPEHQGDIFYSSLTGVNFLFMDEKDATCFSPNMTVTNLMPTGSLCMRPGNPPGWPGGPKPEDVDALEFQNVFIVGQDTTADNLLDVLTAHVFFSIDSHSVSVGSAVPDFRPGPPDGVATPDDILVTPPPGGSFGIYGSGVLDIGLLAGDDLDALCLLDVGTPGFLDPGMDAAHFSLAPGSPSLAAVGGSPADIFFTTFTGTFALAVPAGALGLLSQDNVDALDCQALNDTTGPTDVQPVPRGETPEEFKLYANYPNPFNPSTIISFDLPKRSHVTLKVFNVLGKEVATLVAQELSSGSHRVEWNADGFASRRLDLSSGVYYYRLQAEGFTQTKKMLLLK